MELLSLAKNPVPAGAVVGSFAGYDGAPLRYARWAATRSPHRGTICLFGGRGEFIEKYFEVIADLRRRGFAVATMDWRGQGGSHRALGNKAKGYIGDFGEYDRDLFRFMKGIVLPDCPPPYIALAHSMGANILMRNATMTGSWFRSHGVHDADAGDRSSAATVSATARVRAYAEGWMFDGNVEPLHQRRKRCARQIRAVRGQSTDERSGTICTDAISPGGRAATSARECHRGLVAGGVAGLRSASVDSFPGALKVPMLVFAAGNDEIVSTRAIEEFGVRLKVGTPPAAAACAARDPSGKRQRPGNVSGPPFSTPTLGSMPRRREGRQRLTSLASLHADADHRQRRSDRRWSAGTHPCRYGRTGAFQDWQQRHDVMGLKSALDDDVDEAGGQFTGSTNSNRRHNASCAPRL